MNKNLTSIDKDQTSSQNQANEQNVADLLTVYENQMKDLWAQYVNCLNQNGQTEIAMALREKYFRLYHNYKNDKKWQKAIDNF